MTEAVRRRWFRFAFSLRTLFVVVTVIAMWMGWQMNLVRERQAMREWILDRGGAVDNAREGTTFETLYENRINREEPFISVWRQWFGDKPARFVVLPTESKKEDWLRVINTFPEIYYLGRLSDPSPPRQMQRRLP